MVVFRAENSDQAQRCAGVGGGTTIPHRKPVTMVRAGSTNVNTTSFIKAITVLVNSIVTGFRCTRITQEVRVILIVYATVETIVVIIARCGGVRIITIIVA